ncbi:MAG: hypothetical protein DMF31_12170, partial [Verrucomicrobia bacterium]
DPADDLNRARQAPQRNLQLARFHQPFKVPRLERNAVSLARASAENSRPRLDKQARLQLGLRQRNLLVNTKDNLSAALPALAPASLAAP